MSTVLLVVSHLIIGAVGYFSGKVVVTRAIEAERGEPVSKLPVVPQGIVIGFAFLVVMLGMAVQTLFWQSDQDSHDACLEQWGHEVTQTARARSEASQALEKAGYKRDAALDDLLVGAIQMQDLPDRERQRALKTEVGKYVGAVEKFNDARKAAAHVRAKNDWPPLRCN